MKNTKDNYNNNKVWFALVDSTVDESVFDIEPPPYSPDEDYPEPDNNDRY